jgi:hypothetical protein
MNSGMSIHPGIKNGFRVYPAEKNTKPHKGGGKLAKKMKTLAARRLEHSGTISKGGVPAGAFKTPGSMNSHK